MKNIFKIRAISISVLLLIILPLSIYAQEKPASSAEALPEFNKIVLEVLKTYPTDGAHDYWWPRAGEGNYDGSSKDVYIQNKKVMKGESEKRTYCCGITLEVFFEAYKKWLADHGAEVNSAVALDDWSTFKRDWFVRQFNGPGPSAALENFSLGKEIPAEAALPGDFVQIWRTKNEKGKATGHSVIFLEWVKDDEGKITGMKYWSSQPSTDGISERIEYFGPDGGINPEHTYYGRVEPKAKDSK